jgi:hypothetical protein
MEQVEALAQKEQAELLVLQVLMEVPVLRDQLAQ